MNGNLIVENAAQLVTCSGFAAKTGDQMSDLGILETGAVVIEKGHIRYVGPTSDLPDTINRDNFEIIDASGKAVLPGFVDAHTHFLFGGYRPEEFAWRLRGDSYMEIMARGGGIHNTVAATHRATREELVATGLKRLDSMLSFGVTTVEGKSGYGLDLETEIKQLEVMAYINAQHPVDVVRTFLGAHAVPSAYKTREDHYIDFIIQDVLPEITAKNLAEFCDVFCEKGVFSIAQSRRLLTAAKKAGLKPKLHADEIVPLGGAELAAELGAISADHLLHASNGGIDALAASGVVATLLPGTAFSLKEPFARARTMIASGCAVALATDLNPGSCFSESIPLLFALATLYMGLSPEEAVIALTLNGAAAIDRADSVGSLDPGKKGDLIILEHPSYKFIPYHMGISAVEKTIKNGTVVFDKTCYEVPYADTPDRR
ncbi:MAG: imidazolonepropionase [Desulfobacterales bacterium]|nr:imidazolonepropionase [Desulfobacterales bacterium]